MFTLGGWWGMELWAEAIVQNGGRARVKSKKPAWKGSAGSLMAKMK